MGSTHVGCTPIALGFTNPGFHTAHLPLKIDFSKAFDMVWSATLNSYPHSVILPKTTTENPGCLLKGDTKESKLQRGSKEGQRMIQLHSLPLLIFSPPPRIWVPHAELLYMYISCPIQLFVSTYKYESHRALVYLLPYSTFCFYIQI